MGKKKIDKESLEHLVSKLLHKEDIIGFQFTAGNAPSGIMENRPLFMHCSISKSRSSVVIDGVESYLAEKIGESIFGKSHTVTMEKLRDYQDQFRKLNYEVEEGEFVGKWYWFRISCRHDEILNHVRNLKENLLVN